MVDIRICFVGHITRDRIQTGRDRPRSQPGGTAWYGAQTAFWLGADTEVVTRLAPEDDADLTAELLNLGIHVAVGHSETTTAFLNEYDLNDPGVRYQRVESVAHRLESSDVAGGRDAYVFGPLMRRDVSPSLLQAVAGKPFVGLDIQGLLRSDDAGRVVLARNPELPEFVQWSSVMKASQEEAVVASGARTVLDAIDWFIIKGAGEVLITLGADGSVVATKSLVERVPVYQAGSVVDTTGCGDVALAAYVVYRVAGSTPPVAARAASAAAAIATTQFGVPRISREKIESLVREKETTGLLGQRQRTPQRPKHPS